MAVTMQLQQREGADPAQRLRARLPIAAAVLPASADADLIAQFDARVRRMFGLLDAALAPTLADAPPAGAAIEALRHALHQVAGTAAFFGHVALGTVAGEHDDTLRDARGRVTLADLRAMRVELCHAAAGEA